MYQNTSKFPVCIFKFCKNTYDFPGRRNTIRTGQIFQNIFALNFNRTHKIFQENEIPKEQIKFSKRAFTKFFRNRYDFLGNHTPKGYLLRPQKFFLVSTKYQRHIQDYSRGFEYTYILLDTPPEYAKKSSKMLEYITPNSSFRIPF